MNQTNEEHSDDQYRINKCLGIALCNAYEFCCAYPAANPSTKHYLFVTPIYWNSTVFTKLPIVAQVETFPIMADYSRYGGISPDWTAYIAANPSPESPQGLTPIQLRERTNLGREAHSQEILKKVTGIY